MRNKENIRNQHWLPASMPLWNCCKRPWNIIEDNSAKKKLFCCLTILIPRVWKNGVVFWAFGTGLLIDVKNFATMAQFSSSFRYSQEFSLRTAAIICKKKKTSLPTPSCLCSGIPISKTCIPLEMCQFTQKNGWLERSKFNKNIKLHLLRNVKKIHNQFYPLNHKDSVYFFYKKKWTTLNAFKKIPKNVTNHVKTWPKGFKCQSKQKSCLLNFVNRSYLLNKVC